MLKEIFLRRLGLDQARQPGFREKVLELAGQLSLDHPYDLAFAQQVRLFDAAKCAPGAAGDSARIDAAEYLYRLESLPVLMSMLTWKTGTPSNPLKVHESLLLASGKGRRWLSLDERASGTIHNGRGFTWWTTYERLADEPFRAGHALGLLDDWIPKHAVILRCRLADLRASDLVRVPSVIDGFFSPVFLAALSESTPPHGVTIDLNADELRPGLPELAIRPLGTSLVELMPVLIDEKLRKPPRVRKSQKTWEKLLYYYEAAGA